MAGFWGSHLGVVDLTLRRTADGWRRVDGTGTTRDIRRMMQGTPHAGLPVLSAAAPFKAGGRGGPAYYTERPDAARGQGGDGGQERKARCEWTLREGNQARTGPPAVKEVITFPSRL